MKCFLIFLLGLTPLFGADRTDAGVRVFFTSNRQGEIEPCGCQVNQIGGLNRMKALLDLDDKKIPLDALFADSGDTFYSANPLPERRRDQELARAKIIAKAYKAMKLDVFTPGERDFAAGLAALKELQTLSGSTFLSSNLTDAQGAPLFERFTVLQRGPLKIGVFSLAGEEALASVKEVKVLPPAPVFKKVVAELKKLKVDKILLLSHLGLSGDREIADMGDVDVILGAHSLDILAAPERIGKTAIVQAQNEGQQLGILDFGLGDTMTSRLVDLGKKFDVQNDVSPMMIEYKDSVRKIALDESAKVAPTGTNKPYVAHAQTCRGCHQKQHDWWASTKHASAYLVLYAKNQHFDPECISCHSLGFQEPGGFEKISRPIVLTSPEKKAGKKKPFIEELMVKVFAADPGKGPLDSRVDPARYQKLKARYHEEIKDLEEKGKIQKLYIGVQCEHCHGNRNGHPSPNVATVKKVSETSCRQCHVPPNAPVFDPALIKKIACPLSAKR